MNTDAQELNTETSIPLKYRFSTPVNMMLTAGFFGFGGAYLWLISSVFFG